MLLIVQIFLFLDKLTNEEVDNDEKNDTENDECGIREILTHNTR